MQRKNTKIWIFLLVAPIPILVLSALFQVIIRLLGIDEAPSIIVNILSFIAGLFGVVGLLGFPAWITLLVIAINHNKKIDSSTYSVNQQNSNLRPSDPQAVELLTPQYVSQSNEQRTAEKINHQ